MVDEVRDERCKTPKKEICKLKMESFQTEIFKENHFKIGTTAEHPHNGQHWGPILLSVGMCPL